MLKFWEVWNFMSLEHGKCEFDERGIINIKGYNDSGKSAMLRALDVLFFNIRPNSQVNFIKEGTDYFRVMAYFDDDILILRDKYINGQSLYEMYKGKELIYTTKVNGVLSRVTKVPDVIQEYLGLISFDDGNLNSRSCFEKQFLVQTSGSENYKMLNAVLRSEELARAGELLNNDKNRLLSDINQLDNQLTAYKDLYASGSQITEGMIHTMQTLDSGIDQSGERLGALQGVSTVKDELSAVVIHSEVPLIPVENIKLLSGILSVAEELDGITVFDEIQTVDVDRLKDAESMVSAVEQLDLLWVTPEVSCIDTDRLTDLVSMKSMLDGIPIVQTEAPVVDLTSLSEISSVVSLMNEFNSVVSELLKLDEDIRFVSKELKELTENSGKQFRVCQNCGAYVEV